MYIGIINIWKRILESLGLVPIGTSRRILKNPRTSVPRIKPPEFDSSKQIRILLFRELNGQERRLLFDSKAVRKRDTSSPSGKPDKSPSILSMRRNKENSIEKSFKLSEVQNREYIYEWQKSSSDEEMLREMIFGSVSISYQGTTLKVHTIRSPLQVMISVVFSAPVSMFKIGGQDLDESGTWNNSTSEISISKPVDKSEPHLAHSVPVNVPSRLSGHYAESRDSDSDSLQSHDGYSSLPSTYLSPETSMTCLPRSSSYNSLQRRLLRNKATSIEMGLQSPDYGLPVGECTRSAGQKRVKLGLSIVVTLNENNKQEEKQFNDFLFTHMSLIESHVMNLKDTVVKAYLNRRNFVHIMFEGCKKFQRAVNDLYTAPRLQNPEWLTIISSPNHRHLSYLFLEKFTNLLKCYDKKETNFFVSTLLTAVLTYHLAWVPSVIPTDSKIHSTQMSHKHTPFWVDLLSKSRPYNPHWVQLGDLYGALGFPLKLSKTVIKGQKQEVILSFLQVLSYFIRCSDICEQLYEKTSNPGTESDISQSLSSRGSEGTNKVDSPLSTSTTNSNSSIRRCADPCDVPNLPITSSIYYQNNALKRRNSLCNGSIEIKTHSCQDQLSPHTPTPEAYVPDSTDDAESTTLENSPNVGSLGYESLEDRTRTSSDLKSKRNALQESRTNSQKSSDVLKQCCERLGDYSDLSKKSHRSGGKENNPLISITQCNNCDKSGCLVESCSKVCRPQKCHSSDARKGSSTESCPCDDNQFSSKQSSLECSKMNECESVEEGYHSMEEPHSPSQEKLHLSEMLKRFDNWCPEGLTDMSLPGIRSCGENTDSSIYRSFGWSLMAGVTDHYLMDFCLQGLQGPLVEEEVRQDLVQSSQVHILGEPISEAVCIVADTDKWSVNLLSSNFIGGEKPDSMVVTVAMSSLVSGMCEAVLNMKELGIPPESCIIYLEDRLQELYFRSQMLSDYLRYNRLPIALSKVASVLSVDVSDMPLLMSVASTHSPYLNVHNR